MNFWLNKTFMSKSNYKNYPYMIIGVSKLQYSITMARKLWSCLKSSFTTAWGTNSNMQYCCNWRMWFIFMLLNSISWPSICAVDRCWKISVFDHAIFVHCRTGKYSENTLSITYPIFNVCNYYLSDKISLYRTWVHRNT